MIRKIDTHTDIVRVRGYLNIDRRQLLQGMAAVGGLMAAGAAPSKVHAATAINYVGWEGYDSFLEAGGFLEKSGAEFQKTYISGPDEIITKLRLSANQVDICTPYFIHDDFLANEGLLEPLDLSKIPNFGKIHPVILEICKNNMSEGDRWYAAPMTYGSICMVYNADETVAPTSWADMLKDEYKGKCAITNDPPGNLFAWARVAGVENPSHMTHEELNKTVELLIDLKRNHLRTIAPSYGDLIDMLAKKEIILAQGWEPVSTWVEGANIKPAYPKEKSMSYVEGYAIGKGSSNVDVAHAIINNGLSLEGQLAGAAQSMPVVNVDAMAQDSEANRMLYSYDSVEDYFTVKTQVIPMYPLESDGVYASWDEYQEAWERVLKS